MQEVINIEEFNKLLNKYLNKSYINNANRLIRDGNTFIEKGKLYYYEKDGSLLFFENCKDYYNLYYFISKLDLLIDICDLNLEKPIVADIIYSENNFDETPAKVLINANFEKYLTRSYKTLKLSQKDIEENNNIKFADKDEVNSIFEMQNKYIDKYTGNILSKEELYKDVENKLILVMYEDKKIAGYLRFTVNNKNVSLDGLVIDGIFRGKGYSKQIVEYFIDYCSKEGYKKIDLWVRDDNVSALKLYDLFGFKKAKYKCDNYIKY